MSGAPHSPEAVAGAWAAKPVLTAEQRAELEETGVPLDALLSPTPLRSGPVAWVGDGRFEFDCFAPGDTPTSLAALLLVLDLHGDVADVVAWSPNTGQVGTWLGRAWALGQHLVSAPRLTDGLPVHRDPLGWLQAKRRGLVILNPGLAREHLDYAGPLIAEDEHHGRALRAALAHPGPRILVPAKPQARRAA